MPEGLFGSGGSVVGLPLRPVDVEALTRKRRLREKGEADGRANQPASGASGLAAPEQDVLLHLQAEHARLATDAAAHFKAQNDALAQVETAMDIASLRRDCRAPSDALPRLQGADRRRNARAVARLRCDVPCSCAAWASRRSHCAGLRSPAAARISRAPRSRNIRPASSRRAGEDLSFALRVSAPEPWPSEPWAKPARIRTCCGSASRWRRTRRASSPRRRAAQARTLQRREAAARARALVLRGGMPWRLPH